MWPDEQYIAQLQDMDYLSITIKGDWHRPRLFGHVPNNEFHASRKEDPLDLELFRDNSPYKVTLTSRGEKSHNPS